MSPWTGQGWLVPVIAFVVSFGFEVVVESITGRDDLYQENLWFLALALSLAGVLVWFFAAYLETRKAVGTVDPETGDEVHLRRGYDSFFFLPVRFWSFLLPSLGVGYALLG